MRITQATLLSRVSTAYTFDGVIISPLPQKTIWITLHFGSALKGIAAQHDLDFVSPGELIELALDQLDTLPAGLNFMARPESERSAIAIWYHHDTFQMTVQFINLTTEKGIALLKSSIRYLEVCNVALARGD